MVECITAYLFPIFYDYIVSSGDHCRSSQLSKPVCYSRSILGKKRFYITRRGDKAKHYIILISKNSSSPTFTSTEINAMPITEIYIQFNMRHLISTKHTSRSQLPSKKIVPLLKAISNIF